MRIQKILRLRTDGFNNLFSKALDMAQWKLSSSSPMESITYSKWGAKAGGGPTIRKISNGGKSVDIGGNLGYRLDNLKQMIPTLSLSLHSDAAEVDGDTLRIRDQALFDTIQTAVKPWNDYLESDAGTAKLKSAAADGEISPQEAADIAEEVAKGSAEDIVKELREGKGLGQIAKERGSNRGELIHQLEMAGLDVTVLWDMEKSDVADDIAEGKSLEEVAEERGLSREELIEDLNQPREDNWKGKKEWLEVYDADGELLVGYYDGSDKKGGNELKTRFANDDGNEVERVEKADGEVSKTTSDGEEGKTRTVTKPDGTVEKTVIDEIGRETTTITDTQAEGEPTTKKITNNGYTLTTGTDGKKTLTDESDGMVFPIEKGSVLEGLARTLLDLNPEKSRKDAVLLAAIKRDLANMQLAAAEKAAKESPKERKDHDRQPAIPEAGTGNDGLDPYGKPPADGNLWVPLNGVWMTPEAARSTLQEKVVASWLAEAQAKAAQKQAALDVYALDPNYRQAMDSATTRMNELHAPEMRKGYEWARPRPEGTLADAKLRRTNANRTLEGTSKLREGREADAKRLQGMLAKPTQENIAEYYAHAREAHGDSPSVQSIAFGDKRINVGGSKGHSWENLRLLFPELNDNPNVSMRGGNLTIGDKTLFESVKATTEQWDELAEANRGIKEFFEDKEVKEFVEKFETLFRKHYPSYYFDEQGFKYKTSSTESESGKLKDSRVTLDQASGQLVLRNVYEGEGKGSEDDLVFYFQLTHAPGDPRRGVPRVTTGDADTASGEAGVTIVNPEPRSHSSVTDRTRERSRRLGELDKRWADLRGGDDGLDSLIQRQEAAQEPVDKQFEGLRRQQAKDARERTSAAQDGVDAAKEDEGEGTLVPDGNGEPQQLDLDDAHQKDEGLKDLDGRWVHPNVKTDYLALVAANDRFQEGDELQMRIRKALLSQPEFEKYARKEGYSYEHGQPAVSGKTPTKTTGELNSKIEERNGHLYLVNTYANKTENGTNVIELRLTYDPGDVPEGVERTKEQRQLDKEWATWKEGARDSDTKNHLEDAETARDRTRNKFDRSLDTLGRGSREKVTGTPTDGKNLVLVSVGGNQFWATPRHAKEVLRLNEARAQENALKVGDQEWELRSKRNDFLAGGKQVWALDDGNLTPLLDPQMLRQWALHDNHHKMIGTKEGHGSLTKERVQLLDSQEDSNITRRNLEKRKIAGAEKQEPGLGDLDPKRFVNPAKGDSAEPGDEWTDRERQLLDTKAGRIWLGAQLNLASLKQEENQAEAFRKQLRKDVRWSDFLLTQGQQERRPDNLPALNARFNGYKDVADKSIAERLEAIKAQIEASSKNGLRVDGEGVAEALRLALDTKDNEVIGAVEGQLRNLGGNGAEIEIVPILYRDESTGVRDTALFQVRDKNDGRLWLVDENGSKYRGLDDFQRNSLLSPEGQVYLPTELGRLTDLDGSPAYEWGQARKLSFAEQHLDLPVSLVTGAASLASFTPLAPVAAPIAYAGGTYLGMRSIDKLRTMHAHGRSLASWEGVMEGAMVATSVLPMVSSGARYIGLTGAGVNGSTAARVSIGAISPQSQNPLYQTTSNLMRQRGGAFTTARYADAGALTLGVPLVSYSAYDIAQHGGEMSGLELTNALMGVASGTFGTAYGAIGLKNTWPQGPRVADDAAGETGPLSVSSAYHPMDPPHQTVRLVDEAGVTLDAKVPFGPSPASAEAMYVPPEIGPRLSTEQLRGSGKMHLATSEREWVMPSVRGGSEKSEPAATNPNQPSRGIAYSAEQGVMGSRGPSDLSNRKLTHLIHNHALYYNQWLPGQLGRPYPATEAEMSVFMALRDTSAEQGHAVRFAVGNVMPQKAFHQQGGGLELEDISLFSSFSDASEHVAKQPVGNIPESSGRWVYKVVVPEQLAASWARQRTIGHISTKQIEGGLWVYSGRWLLFPGPVVNSQYVGQAGAANQQLNQSCKDTLGFGRIKRESFNPFEGDNPTVGIRVGWSLPAGFERWSPGKYAREMIVKSPTLRSHYDEATQKYGTKIVLGPNEKGTYYDSEHNVIVLARWYMEKPDNLLITLAHELSHAVSYQRGEKSSARAGAPISTRPGRLLPVLRLQDGHGVLRLGEGMRSEVVETSVDANLQEEGVAVLNEFQVHNEWLRTGKALSDDVRPFVALQDWNIFQIYEKYRDGRFSWQEATVKLGEVVAELPPSVNSSISYRQYYTKAELAYYALVKARARQLEVYQRPESWPDGPSVFMAAPEPNHLSGSAASPAQQRVFGSTGPSELLNLETLVYQHAMYRDPTQLSLPKHQYEPTPAEVNVLNMLRDPGAAQGNAVRFAVGEEIPLEAFHQQGGGLNLAHARLFSSFDAAVDFAASLPPKGMRQTPGGWVYKIVAPEPLVNAWIQPRPDERISTAQIEGGLRVYSDGGLFPGPVVNSQYAAPVAMGGKRTDNEPPNQLGRDTPPARPTVSLERATTARTPVEPPMMSEAAEPGTRPVSLERPMTVRTPVEPPTTSEAAEPSTRPVFLERSVAPRALSVSPEAEGRARVYRLEDIEALNQASQHGALPPGHYVHLIRTPELDTGSFALQRGTVPRSGLIDEGGNFRWPAGREIDVVNGGGRIHVVVSELSAGQIRERFRSGEGLPFAVYRNNGFWSASSNVSTSPPPTAMAISPAAPAAQQQGMTPPRPTPAVLLQSDPSQSSSTAPDSGITVTMDADGPIVHIHNMTAEWQPVMGNSWRFSGRRSLYDRRGSGAVPETIAVERNTLEMALGSRAVEAIPSHGSQVRVSIPQVGHEGGKASTLPVEPSGPASRLWQRLSPNAQANVAAGSTVAASSAGATGVIVGLGDHMNSMVDGSPAGLITDLAGTTRGGLIFSKARRQKWINSQRAAIEGGQLNQRLLNWDISRIYSAKRALALGEADMSRAAAMAETLWAKYQFLNSLPVSPESESRGWTTARRDQAIREAVSDYQRGLEALASPEVLSIDPLVDPRTRRGQFYQGLVTATHAGNVGVSAVYLANGGLFDSRYPISLQVVDKAGAVGFMWANTTLGASAAAKMGTGLAKVDPGRVPKRLDQLIKLGTANGSFFYAVFTPSWAAFTTHTAATAFAEGKYVLGVANGLAVPFQVALSHVGIEILRLDSIALRKAMYGDNKPANFTRKWLGLGLVPWALLTTGTSIYLTCKGEYVEGGALGAGALIQLHFILQSRRLDWVNDMQAHNLRGAWLRGVEADHNKSEIALGFLLAGSMAIPAGTKLAELLQSDPEETEREKVQESPPDPVTPPRDDEVESAPPGDVEQEDSTPPPKTPEESDDAIEEGRDGETEETGRFNPELKDSAGYEEIIVLPGQTIGGIAVRHGRDITEVVLLNMDHIPDPSLLYPGDRIYLPK
ncbi:hypothetical protein [Halomonas sp. A29]|uniref:hypothetical protein n=1 Tax=Halomonas sp. A29 TaxID=3102786 RepID=UPI00398AE2D8